MKKCPGETLNGEKTSAVVGQCDGIAVFVTDPRKIAIGVKMIFKAWFGHQGERIATVIEIMAKILVSCEYAGISLRPQVFTFVALPIQVHRHVGIKQAAHLHVIVHVPAISKTAVVLTLTAIGPDEMDWQHPSGERQVRDS